MTKCKMDLCRSVNLLNLGSIRRRLNEVPTNDVQKSRNYQSKCFFDHRQRKLTPAICDPDDDEIDR